MNSCSNKSVSIIMRSFSSRSTNESKTNITYNCLCLLFPYSPSLLLLPCMVNIEAVFSSSLLNYSSRVGVKEGSEGEKRASEGREGVKGWEGVDKERKGED